MLHVFPVFVGGESVHLDTEGHSFLPAMLPGGELSADAVDLRRHDGRGFNSCEFVTAAPPPGIYMYLDENRSVLDRIPEELDGVEVQRV